MKAVTHILSFPAEAHRAERKGIHSFAAETDLRERDSLPSPRLAGDDKKDAAA
jgi:hypothetical protein